MNDFIKLNRTSDSEIYLNPTLVSELSPVMLNDKQVTLISMFNGNKYTVTESVKEVLKLIENESYFKTKTY